MISDATFNCLNNFTFLKWLNFVFLKGVKNMNGVYFFLYVILGKEFRKVIKNKWKRIRNQLVSNSLINSTTANTKSIEISKISKIVNETQL